MKFKIKKFIYEVCIFFFVFLRARYLVQAKPKRIVVFGTMGVGNLVMLIPLLKAIRIKYPKAEIVLICKESHDQLLSNLQLVDRFVFAKPTDFGPYKLGLSLWLMGVDQVYATFHAFDYRKAIAIAGAPLRFGHIESPGWEFAYGFIFNRPFAMKEDQHEVERGLLLLSENYRGEIRPSLEIEHRVRESGRKVLESFGLISNSQYFVIQMDSWQNQAWKRWPSASFAELAAMVQERYGWTPVILGAPGTDELVGQFKRYFSGAVIDLTGKTNLGEACSIISDCQLMICNDSGLMHIAAALSKKTIAIYGPTDFRRTSPRFYSENVYIARQLDLPCSPCFRLAGDRDVISCIHKKCLTELTADAVFSMIEKTV